MDAVASRLIKIITKLSELSDFAPINCEAYYFVPLGIRDDPFGEVDHRAGDLRPSASQDPGRPPEEHRGRVGGAGRGRLRREQVKPEILLGRIFTGTTCSHKVCFSVALTFSRVLKTR